MNHQLILRPAEESRLAALKSSLPAYCKTLAPREISQVFDSPEPQLSVISRRLGETGARAVVVYLLSEALEFFNVRDTMNDTQVAVTVDLILEEYPYLKTDDLKLCFRRAMKLRYGELYNRIDGQVVLGWLMRYVKERCAEADRLNYNEHKRHLAEQAQPTEGLFYEEYRSRLAQQAASGDAEAARRLELSNSVSRMLRAYQHSKSSAHGQETNDPRSHSPHPRPRAV